MTEQSKGIQNKFGTAVRLICVLLIAVMPVIAVIVYGAPLGQMATLLLFFLFYIQLPGMLIAGMAGLNKGHVSTYLAAGTFTGWAVNILAYFISDSLDNNIVLMAAGPVLSFAFIAGSIAKSKRECSIIKKIRFNRVSLALCIFTTLVLFYCLVNTQYRYLAPELCDTIYVNPDKAYHMGIINALSHGYPLHSLWVQGKTMKYHIFTEILLSIPVRLFGVRADVMSVSFSPYFTAYCFAVSFYSFFREMAEKPGRAGLYCLIFFPSMMFNIRRWTSSFAFKLILTNDNYAGYGLAAMLVTIVVFSKWYDKYKEGERGHIKMLALCVALTMMVTGIKGPIAAVFVAGLWGTMLLGIIMKKVKPGALLPLILITAAFLLIYMTVLGAQGQVNEPGGAALKLAGITNIAFWKEAIIDFLSAHGIPKSLRLVAVLLIFMAFFFTIYLVPFCAGYIREFILVISGRKDFEPAKVLVYAECLVGFVAMMIFSYSGHSQVYFGLVTLILAPAVAYWFLEDMEKSRASSKGAKYALRVTAGIMALTILFTCTLQVSYFNRRIKDAVSYTKPEKSEDMYLSISNSEYEAMRWIDNNTEKDALLANDRYYSIAPDEYDYDNRWDNRFFLYEVYANRPSYISGSGFDMSKEDIPLRIEMVEKNNQLYDVNNSGRGDLARDLGVDYVIVSKRFTDIPDLSNEDYELCFTNDDVDVYSVNNP